MRKRLLFLAVLAAICTPSHAQQLFFAPDTVCIKQPIQLANNTPGASSYFWSFCSGYTLNTPTAVHPADTFKYSRPSAVEIARDGNSYYGFVTTLAGELLRLDFGDSLNSVPGITNFGDMRGTIPDSPSSLYMVRDGSNWHLFVTGGFDSATSSLARVDFGTSLGSQPNSVNFGNLQGLLRAPRGLFIAQEGGLWTGFFTNDDVALTGLTGLGRLDFGTNISLTPFVNTPQQFGGFLSGASDLAAIKRDTTWYFYVTNSVSSSLTLYTLNGGLRGMPVGNNLGNFGGNALFGPSGISVTTDCGGYAAFITSFVSNELTRISIGNPADLTTYTDVNFGNLGNPTNFANPTAISPIVRDSADLFAFVANFSDSTLTRLNFLGCDDATIASSTRFTPPVYRYDTPGTYNVYFVANDGQPDARTACQQIVVLPYPAIDIEDDTLICQGDTARLFVNSVTATSIRWRPPYNLLYDDTVGNLLFAYPEYSVDYRVTLAYANGCIVDTGIQVTVSKVFADAGPDRTLNDGAASLLGGPGTTAGPQYAYRWTPANFLNRDDIQNPLTRTPVDFTYYLTVTNESGCQDIDTVVVKVDCNDINLPNAFTPGGPNPTTAHFGLLNRNIIKLNFFRVYDRWGKKLFETTDPTKEWDGTVEGERALYGVYIWEADGFCSSGRRFNRTGNVTLIR